MPGQLFTRVNEEYGHGEALFGKPPEKGFFLETVGLPAQPFDAIAVDSFFEMTAAGSEAGLKGGWKGFSASAAENRRRGRRRAGSK